MFIYIFHLAFAFQHFWRPDFPMTVNAIRSLHRSTPDVAVGVIIPPSIHFEEIATQLTAALPDFPLLNIVQGRTHFTNWNPTQVSFFLPLFTVALCHFPSLY
jgi:hypothetical protein